MGQTFDSELEDLIAKYRASEMGMDEIISEMELRLMALRESADRR